MKLEAKRNYYIPKVKSEERLKSLLGTVTPLIAILFSIVIGGIVIAMAGVSPVYAYYHLWYGAFGTIDNFTETLVKTTPILIAGIGLSISFRCNLLNIGAEGQMIVGAITAVVVSFTFQELPAILAVPLCIVGGFIGGAAFGVFAGFLKAKYGTSEIISTIMLNYIAISFLGFLLDGPLKEPDGYFPQTALVPDSTQLIKIIEGTRLHIGFIIGIILIGLYYLLMFRLPLGFKIRAVGLNQNAAQYAGISVKKHIVIAMALSGGLAGIAGMSEIFGIYHRLYNGFSSGYGFDAVAIALLGKLNPLGVPLAALFFGALRVGGNAMQNAVQVPIAVIYIIQGVSVLFILTDSMIRETVIQFFRKRKQSVVMDQQMEVE